MDRKPRVPSDLVEALNTNFGPTARRNPSGLIVIDDRSEKDVGANGRLYSWFCQMFAEVLDPTMVRVILRGNVPIGPSVQRWLRLNKLEEPTSELVFDVSPADVEKLKSLAAGVRSIVKRGARYSEPSYKYVCPRVAATLDRLHVVLRSHWKRSAVSERPK